MKKFYILIFTLSSAYCVLNAQSISIEENFDDYTLGDLGNQNPDVWGVWSGNINGSESIGVSDAFANSGSQSGFIGAGPGPQDAILRLGNITATGMYELTFNMYIPAGKSGYFNFQGQTTSTGGAGNGGMGVFNSSNLIFYNQASSTGMPGLAGSYDDRTDDEPAYSWNYPEDEWFPISIVFELDEATEFASWTMTVNGVELATRNFNVDRVIGGIDFFGIDANNEYYIDDITFDEIVLSNTVNPILQSAQIYPNPVSDILNIRTEENVDEVVLYDLLGRRLLSKTPDANATTLDMSGIETGIYMLEMRIDGDRKSIKIVKDF